MALYAGLYRNYRRKNKRLVEILLLFMIFICISTAFSDEYSGQIILEKTSFNVDEEFLLSILIPEISPMFLEIAEPDLPPSISITKGPYIRPGRIGSVADYYLKIGKEGRFIIGSFSLKGPDAVQYTVPVFVTAGLTFHPLKSFDMIPPEVMWDLPDTVYFPGQAVPLQFTIINMEINDVIIESTVLKKPEGIVRRISRTSEKYEKSISVKKIMTGEIYDITFHNHIFVPLGSGNAALPDIEVYLSKDEASYDTILPGKILEVKQIPEKIKKTGAIGRFTYSYRTSGTQITLESGITLKQKVEGSGNFYTLNIPPPYTDRPDITEITLTRDRLEAAPAGKSFAGYREVTYRLRIKCDSDESLCSGSIQVYFPEFAWMSDSIDYDFKESAEYHISEGGHHFIDIVEKLDKYFQFSLNDDSGIEADLIFKVVIIIIIAGFFPLMTFVRKEKYKKRVIIAVFLLFLIITAVYVKTAFFGESVYGVVFVEADTVSVLSIPDETGRIVAEVSAGQRVKILNNVEQYYLISFSEGENGWINKESIRIEE